MTAALDVRQLTKRFGATHALRGVSFSVGPGEILGYLGPNGAGKTTTLRILLDLVRATSGSASLLGVPSRDPASRGNIGFVPGDLHLYGDMSALSALDFFARFRPRRPTALRSMLLEALALDGAVLERRIKFLSHGTRQKLGLVAAMQHDPALLLLDEPTNGLDPLVQQAFRGVLRELARRGAAVLLSSHVLSEVQATCDRVAILRDGAVVALEAIAALRERAVRRMVVRFAEGAPPGLGSIAGVARCEVRGAEATLWVRGDLNPLLRALAANDVGDVVFPEAQLEDMFFAYYAARDA